MEHPKCSTCKHFKSEADDWDAPPGFGQCSLALMSCWITKWNKSTREVEVKEEYKEHLMSVMDGSSYRALLHTHPDFYCPMHSDLKNV